LVSEKIEILDDANSSNIVETSQMTSKFQKSETCDKDSKFTRTRNPEEKKLMFLTGKVLDVIKLAGVTTGEIVA